MRQQLGGIGPIPEGMSPSGALSSRAYTARHAALKSAVRSAAAQWQALQGYRPAYWTLVALARDGVVPARPAR
jgi:hypothetical protein